jgi:hypothetical protein
MQTLELAFTRMREKAGEIMSVLFPTDANGTPTGEVNVAGAWDMVAAEWEKAWPKIEPVLADLWAKFTAWWGSEDTQQSIKDIGASLAGALGELGVEREGGGVGG